MTTDYLVDTHIWLWYAQGNLSRLTEISAARLTELDRDGRLYLSVMSAWELGLLTAKGRIHLGRPCADWVSAFLKHTRYRIIELDIGAALEANSLPGAFHADPVDRLLVATARIRDLTLITEDRGILDYAQKGYLRACPGNGKELLKS